MERWNWGRRTMMFLAAFGGVDYIFRSCPEWLRAVGIGIVVGAYFYDFFESESDRK